jgi:hypothetical protein
MPGASYCNKIKDPIERRKCLQYKGKYAKDKSKSKKSKSKNMKGGY